MCSFYLAYHQAVFLSEVLSANIFRKVKQRVIKSETKSVISSINLRVILVGHEINWCRLWTHLLFWQLLLFRHLLIGPL